MSKLLAPNGKQSNLTPEQYALVRTPQFKAWFGDWENNPESASKVVDENGEPLVVYRGWSSNSKFGNTFGYKRNLFRDTSAISSRKSNRFGFYFTENKKIAENYAKDFAQAYNEQIEGSAKEIATPIVQGYFLNVRNICDISPTNKKFQNLRSRISGVKKVFKGKYDLKEITEWEVNRYTTTLGMKSLSEIVGFNRQDIENELDDVYLRRYDSNYANDIFANMIHNDYDDNIDEFLKAKLIQNKFDGVKFQEDTHYYTSLSRKEKILFDQNEKKGIIQNYPLVYTAFEPNQIKLADGTNTTFNKNNPDIRYNEGGTTKNNMKKIDKGGITYGRSHAEGGIPVKNKSTGQMLEVEGGEGIINKKAMASPQMVKIDGKEMTICEAASYLNQKDGNGRQFNCDDVEHQQFITDHYGIGGTVMNNQDAENAIFDATVLEHGGTTTAYDAGLHKKMYMLGIEVMQPNPIALAKAMSNENDNFCEHYPKLCAGAEYQREELPQIYDKNYDEFVAYLENLGATVNFESEVSVDSLKPVQNEISLERMARIMVRVKEGYYKDLNLLKLPLFVSKDGYILDGHHRWATLFFLSPTNTLDIYRVNLTYKELVNKALNFDDAGTEKFMIGGMVKRQQDLDTATRRTRKFVKGEITFYSFFDDSLRYGDLVRIEGSSQALMSNMFKTPLFTFWSSLGNFVCGLLNRQLIDITTTLEKTKGFTKWSISTEPTVTKEKRSQAIDITMDYMRVSFGIRDWFDTGTSKYNRTVIALYSSATVNFIESVIQILQDRDWTAPTLTLNDFINTDDYKLAARIYQENIEKIITVVEDELKQSSQNLKYDISNADLTLVTTGSANLSKTVTPSTVNMQGTYSYFDVAYANASGEIRYDFTDPPKDCRVEIACNVDSQITVLDDMGFNRQTSKREELFTDFLVEELNSTTAKLGSINQDYLLYFQGKSSDPYTVVAVNLGDTSWGLSEMIESDLPISNYLIYNISSAVANFAGTLLEMLDSTGWRGSGIPKFKQDSRYKDAIIQLEKDLQVAYDVGLHFTKEFKAGTRQITDVNFSKWLNNFKQFPKSSPSSTSMANKVWSWRFKTEQEFIDEYGIDWETSLPNDAVWGSDMDEFNMTFLFGKPISENPTSKKVVQDLYNGTEVERLVNVEEYFGIKNPNPNGYEEFNIWECFLTNKPLPNAVNITAPVSQKGSLYYALESDYLAAYPRYNRMKVENRFSYKDWEDMVKLYKTAQNLGRNADSYFIFAICVVYNTSRMLNFVDETEVRDMLDNNSPSDAMRELFSANYYFSPIYFNFYANLIEQIHKSYLKSGQNPINTGSVVLDSLLQVVDYCNNLSSTGMSNKGFAGLGDFREHIGGKITYPDIITTEYEADMQKAYYSNSSSLQGATLDTFVQNLTYKNDKWSDTLLQQNAVPVIEALVNSFYEYQDISAIDKEALYATNSKSKLYDYQISNGNRNFRNDFIFWDFTRPLLPQNFFILADYETLLENFETDGYITSVERSDLDSVGYHLQIRSHETNGNFLASIQDIPYDRQGSIIKGMVGWDNLTTTEQLAFVKFMMVYNNVVVQKSREKIAQIFEETTTGVMQRSGVGYMPTATTTPTPKTVQSSNGVREVYYNELMYNSAALKPTEKIIGARFLTKQEILDYNSEYQTSEIGLFTVTVASDFQKMYSEDNLQNVLDTDANYKWIKDLQGKNLNPNLLPAVKAIFEFQSGLPKNVAKEVFRTDWLQPLSDYEMEGRLRFGRTYFDNYDFWEELFPKITEEDYKTRTAYGEITTSAFPDWYKKMVDIVIESRKKNDPKYKISEWSTGSDVYNGYYVLTGEEKQENITLYTSYMTIPVSYLVLQIEDQSASSTPKPKATTVGTKKVIKSVPLIELFDKGVLQKNDKIVSARFLTEKEIEDLKIYQLSKAGFLTTLWNDSEWNSNDYPTEEEIYNRYKGTESDYSMLMGMPLNPKLLPAVIEVFKFYKGQGIGIERIKRTPYQDRTRSRLSVGIDSNNYKEDLKKLFPNASNMAYESFEKYDDIISYDKFPEWYKAFIEQQIESQYNYAGKQLTKKEVQNDYDLANDLFYPYYFYTGIENDKYEYKTAPYGLLPFAYLMVDIETEEAVTTPVSNASSIQKLKEEYAAIQYYLNVEVPIDAFAQRKLISSVLQDVSNKLEKEIEALYYAPSFEPLFDLWANKQTQGQRTINLQPCMLPTPNGQKSELDVIQYEIVRTEEFKKWFGDWEEAAVTGNYNGVSKAINPVTQEPQVVFHGKANMILEFTKMAFATFPVKYFGTNLSYAEWFRENQSKSDTLTKLVYEFFLNIKNPIDLSPIGVTELTAEDLKEVIKAQYNYTIKSPILSEGTGYKLKLWQLIRGSQQMLEELKTNTYFDGLIMYEDNPSDRTASGYDSGLLGFSPNSYEVVQFVNGTPDGNFTLDYVTFNNFQIKAADGRNRTFFNNVEDFRFAKGGLTKKRKK
jgi:hypothetical protein